MAEICRTNIHQNNEKWTGWSEDTGARIQLLVVIDVNIFSMHSIQYRVFFFPTKFVQSATKPNPKSKNKKKNWNEQTEKQCDGI